MTTLVGWPILRPPWEAFHEFSLYQDFYLVSQPSEKKNAWEALAEVREVGRFHELNIFLRRPWLGRETPHIVLYDWGVRKQQ